MSRCVRSCGRKARHGERLCEQCKQRTETRLSDQGRLKPKGRYWRGIKDELRHSK